MQLPAKVVALFFFAVFEAKLFVLRKLFAKFAV